MISDTSMELLTQVAAASVRFGLEHEAPLVWSPRNAPEDVVRNLGVFVSLTYKGECVGCQGIRGNGMVTFDACRVAAFNAAYRDRRFQNLTRAHFDELELQVHVLDSLESAQLPVTIEGWPEGQSAILRFAPMRRIHALYLPEVVKKFKSYEKLRTELAVKARINEAVPDSDLILAMIQTQSSTVVRLSDVPALTLETRPCAIA